MKLIFHDENGYCQVLDLDEEVNENNYLNENKEEFNVVGLAISAANSQSFLYFVPFLKKLREKKIPFFAIDPTNQSRSWIKTALDDIGISHVITDYDNFSIFDPRIIENKTGISKRANLFLLKLRFERKRPEYSFKTRTIAYVVQTSGTTGKRKSVFVSEDSIESNVSDFKKIFGAVQSEIFVFSPPTFDPFYVDVFTGLDLNFNLHFFSPRLKASPAKLSAIISNSKTNLICQMTPTLYKSIEQYLSFSVSKKVSFILGGEYFPSELRIRQHENIQFYNVYGVTEMSCWQSMVKINDLSAPVKPIFKIGDNLISRTRIYLEDLSDGSEIHEDDKIGEIVVSSETRRCFINGLINSSGYRTGDTGFYRNGFLYFGSRNSDFLKINGKRVSLKECEVLLSEFFKIDEIVCLPNKDGSSFVAFIKEEKSEDYYFEILRRDPGFPSYLIPARIIVRRTSFPFNNNGKIDRSKLLEDIDSEANFDLKKLWKKYLHIDPEENDNFIICGGDSHLAVLFVSEIQHETEAELVELVLNKTFKDLDDYLKQKPQFEPPPRHEFQKSLKRRKTEHNNKVGYFRRGVYCGLSDARSSLNSELSLKWKVDLEKCVDASPLICDDFVYVGSHSGKFVSANLKTGLVKWTIFLPDRIESSAAVSDDGSQVFVGCYDTNLYSINSINGTINWKFKTNGIVKSSPIYTKSMLIFGSYDHFLYCLSEDGILNWKIQLSGGSITTTPVLTEDESALIATTIDGRVAKIVSETSEMLWKVDVKTPIFGTGTSVNGVFVCGGANKRVFGIAQETGSILWTFDGAGDSIFSSVSKRQDLIAFGCHDNHAYVIRVLEGDFEFLQKIQHPSIVFATPVFLASNRILTLSVDGTLIVTDLEVGKLILRQEKIADQTFSSPAFIRDILVVGSRDNFLYGFSK